MDDKKEIRKLNKDQFKKQCIERFGKDNLKWRFICPVCGLVQTAQDFIDLDKGFKSYKDVSKIIGFTCIGFFTAKIQKKKYSEVLGAYNTHKGCCYSCDMLFSEHSIEVEYFEKNIKRIRKFFDFAS